MIGTPAQLTAYLQALATNHKLVALVITGEGSRHEAATRATVVYPLVTIETPSVAIPVSDDQKILSTRIYVVENGINQSQGAEDALLDKCYRIAEDLVFAIQQHVDGEMNINIARDGIEILPIISNGSDQTSGWMFDVNILAEKDTCAIGYDMDDFFLPRFSWFLGNDNPAAPEINAEDETIGSGVTKEWFYREAHSQPEPDDFEIDQPLELEAVSGSTYRLIEVWLKATKGGRVLWSYCLIDTRFDKGVSGPHIPSYPE